MTRSQLLDKLFRDKHGNIAVVQLPNVPLVVWLVATIASHILRGNLQAISRYVMFVSILVWAGLEILSGSSLVRRILGGIVLVFVVVNKL